jgi:5-methylcytosine-specific restriction endonuclease McrA
MMVTSEQVLETHEFANITGVFFMPANNCIPVRRKVRCSSFHAMRATPVLAKWVSSHDEQRTLRVQETDMAGRTRTRNPRSQQLARNRIVAKRGEKCEKCGSKALIELHHIVRAKDGGTFADENCILLCWLCHQKAHGNKPSYKGMDYYNGVRARLGEI